MVIGISPGDCTEIKPPLLICASGYIPVFKNGHWVIVKDDIWRPKPARESNYDAGRDSITYTPIYIASMAFPSYPSLPMICNSTLIVLEIGQKIRVVQRKLKELNQLHTEMKRNFFKLNEFPTDGPALSLKGHEENEANIYRYHFLCDEMVSHMRTTIDRLVQLSYILTDFEDYISSKHIKISQIGNLGNNNNPQSAFEKIIIGDGEQFRSDSTGFLSCLNDLSNSFKHSVMHAEIYHQYGDTVPAVVSYQAKQNDHKKEIIYHNHNAYHLVMGFQDTVIRIIQNHRKYCQLRNA